MIVLSLSLSLSLCLYREKNRLRELYSYSNKSRIKKLLGLIPQLSQGNSVSSEWREADALKISLFRSRKWIVFSTRDDIGRDPWTKKRRVAYIRRFINGAKFRRRVS